MSDISKEEYEIILEKLKKLKELTPEELKFGASSEYWDDITFLFNETHIYQYYDEDMKSYEKYENDEGWGNAMFHYFSSDVEDLENLHEWLNYVYKKELSDYKEKFPIEEDYTVSKYWNNEGEYQKKLSFLTDKLVPEMGMGEDKLSIILNGVNTFVYDLYNNGLCNLDIHKELYEELKEYSKDFKSELNVDGKYFLIKLSKAIELSERTESDYDYLGYDEDEDYDDYTWEDEKRDDINNFVNEIINSKKMAKSIDNFVDTSVLYVEKEYLKRIGEKELVIEEEKVPDNESIKENTTDTLDILKGIDENILLQIAKNELDVVTLSQIELQNRGINNNGEKVGYEDSVKQWNKHIIDEYKNKQENVMKKIESNVPSLTQQMKELQNNVSEYDNEVSNFNDTYGDSSSDTDVNKKKNK